MYCIRSGTGLFVCLLLLNGCAAVSLDAGFSVVGALVEDRGGLRVFWNNGTDLDKEAAARVDALLGSELTADDAVQIALINNRELQALYSDLGVAQAAGNRLEFNTIVDQTRRFTVEDVHEASLPSGGGGMDYPRPDLSVPYVAPRSEVESAVAAVWQDLLGLREVGVEDNFFELGGNSLIGVSAVAKVRSALDLDHLAPNAIVQAPTVSALTALIDATAAAEPKDDEGDVDRQARADRRKQNLKARRR